MFLLVPAYPGCPGSKAVKRSLLLLLCIYIASKSKIESRAQYTAEPGLVWNTFRELEGESESYH